MPQQSSDVNQGYLSITEWNFLVTCIPVIYQEFKTGII